MHAQFVLVDQELRFVVIMASLIFQDHIIYLKHFGLYGILCALELIKIYQAEWEAEL